MAGQMTAQQQAQAAAQANAMARALILAKSITATQQIASNTFNPQAGNNVWNVPPRAVGLLQGFFLECKATIANTDGAVDATLTTWGAANLITQCIFTDLANQQRHNTGGWHLFSVMTMKRKRVWGSATTTDTPTGFKNITSVISAPSTIAHGTSGTVKMIYYVPISYAPTDFRGAIYLGVVNATANLAITVNPTPCVAAASDPTYAIYQGPVPANCLITTITINVYQRYWDQLPQGPRGAFLPEIDMATVYLLQSAQQPTGIVANQDFPIAFANFRSFLSAVAIFDNQTAGSYPAALTDVAYWALQSANYTNIFKTSPGMVALEERNEIGDDFPLGAYGWDFRRMPIATIQYGNFNLILNASTVNTNANVNMGYEMFALVDQIVGAGSLPPG